LRQSAENVNLVYDIANLVDDTLEATMIKAVLTANTRRTETPNATMITLASPTLGATDGLSLWQVEMTAGASGPRHVFDSEQLWTVREGRIVVEVAGESCQLGQGDTVVLAAGAERQIHAVTDALILVCGYGHTTVSVPGEPSSRGTPPWIA
jgi:quercetin dioxygenase-like cupin family protein